MRLSVVRVWAKQSTAAYLRCHLNDVAVVMTFNYLMDRERRTSGAAISRRGQSNMTWPVGTLIASV